MKLRAIFTLLIITINSNVYAITFKVIGPCDPVAVFQGSIDLQDESSSVGSASIEIFEKYKIPYRGTVDGLNSILGTPTGDESIEIISDTKMRAYGWCYSVNGIEPDVISSEYFFKSKEDNLVWFYAYSTYDSGNWIDYCVPSYKISSPQFCAK
jgi:hypothetical protein